MITTLPPGPSARNRSAAARASGGVGDRPRRDGQALGHEQGLGVGFLDLHAARAPLGTGRDCGRAMVPTRRPAVHGRRRRWNGSRGDRLAILAERGRTARHRRGARCSETSWSERGEAITTPSPSWQAPRSPGWIPPPGSSSGTPNRPRTRCRTRSCGPGVICPRSGIRTASTPGSTGCSFVPASTRRGGCAAIASTSPITPLTRRSPPTIESTVADRDQIERGFVRLDPEQRAVIVLHHYLDLPLAEVAVTLGIPLGTVKSRLHRGARPDASGARRRCPDGAEIVGGPSGMTDERRLRAAARHLAPRTTRRSRVPDHIDKVLVQTVANTTAAVVVEPGPVASDRADAIGSMAPRPGSSRLILILVRPRHRRCGARRVIVGSRRPLPPPFGPLATDLFERERRPVHRRFRGRDRDPLISGPTIDFGPASRATAPGCFSSWAPTTCGQPIAADLVVANADGTGSGRPRRANLARLARLVAGWDAMPSSSHGLRRRQVIVLNVVDVDTGRGHARRRPSRQPAPWLPPSGTEILSRGEQVQDTIRRPGSRVRPDGSRAPADWTRPALDPPTSMTWPVSPDGSSLRTAADRSRSSVRDPVLDLRSGVEQSSHTCGAAAGRARLLAGRPVDPLSPLVRQDSTQLVVAPMDGGPAASRRSARSTRAGRAHHRRLRLRPRIGSRLFANYDAEKVTPLLPVNGSPGSWSPTVTWPSSPTNARALTARPFGRARPRTIPKGEPCPRHASLCLEVRPGADAQRPPP